MAVSAGIEASFGAGPTTSPLSLALSEQVAPRRDPGPPRASLRGVAGVASSPGVGAVPIGELALRFGPAGWGLGLAVEAGAAAPLQRIGDGYTEQRLDVLGGAWWRPAPWVELGPELGAARRAWSEAGVSTGAAWTPLVGGGLHLAPPRGAVAPTLSLRAGVDLRGTEVSVAGQAAGRLSPWWGRLGLGLEWRPARGPS
jgi:hypothetical protein